MFESVDPESIRILTVMLNQIAGESGVIFKPNELQSVVASTDYYPDFDSKLISIFRSLIKNHAFGDGNKRTATMFLKLLLAHSKRKIDLPDDEFIDLITNIAKNNYSVDEIKDMVFKHVVEDQMRHWINIAS